MSGSKLEDCWLFWKGKDNDDENHKDNKDHEKDGNGLRKRQKKMRMNENTKNWKKKEEIKWITRHNEEDKE